MIQEIADLSVGLSLPAGALANATRARRSDDTTSTVTDTRRLLAAIASLGNLPWARQPIVGRRLRGCHHPRPVRHRG
jgi:hypothetical protein